MATAQPTLARTVARPRRTQSPERQLIGMWFGLRIFTWLWLVLWAPLRPITDLEKAVPFWPPSGPVGLWLQRVLVEPWMRWDVKYFVWIAGDGYKPDNGTASFHLLYPFLAKPVAWLTGSPLLGLLLVASLATALLVVAAYRLARLDLSEDAAQVAVRLMLAFPVSAVLFAPYSESLFLLCTALVLLWTREQRWWMAGVAGAAAALTRQQGVFLMLPMLWEAWESSGRNWRALTRDWRRLAAIALVPLGLLAWIVYRSLAIHSMNADFSSLRGIIYSVIISPTTRTVVSVQDFLWPWEALWRGISITWAKPSLGNVLNLSCGALFLAMTAIAWKSMRGSYRLYTLVTIAVSFAFYTGPEFPYMGLPRHLLLALPVFIGFGAAAAQGKRRHWIAPLFLFTMLFLLLLFALEGWVP